MSTSLFDTFQVYFKQANHEIKSLDVVRESSKFSVSDAGALKGLDLLWNIFLQAD